MRVAERVSSALTSFFTGQECGRVCSKVEGPARTINNDSRDQGTARSRRLFQDAEHRPPSLPGLLHRTSSLYEVKQPLAQSNRLFLLDPMAGALNHLNALQAGGRL